MQLSRRDQMGFHGAKTSPHKRRAKVTVTMVDAALSGGTPEINDEKTYDNGVKDVPSYLLEPVSVNLSNYEAILVGSGYYTADQLK